MSGIALAHLERPRALKIWAWALTHEGDSQTYLDVHSLAADGMPADGKERALAQLASAPVGAAGWLASEDGAGLTPCVVVGVTSDGERLRALTPHGEVDATPDRVRPVPSPGARPYASGPAVVTARTGLARVAIDARRFALRWATTWLRGVHERDGLGGATWIDVALLPHQIAAARAVLGSPTVRHVLADEVGLGKTIEALMIWSALSAHDRSLRCVISAPRSLVTQWCLEVRRRAEHRLMARASDDIPPVFVPDAKGDAMDADNPRGIVITEHDALVALKGRASVIDMLIVDEAHSLNAEQRDAVEAIARSAEHLLLLTATPREGRRGSGAAREFRKGFAWAVGLVDPKWPPPDALEGDVERALERTVDASFLRGRECDIAIIQAVGDTAGALLESEAVGELKSIPVSSRAREDLRAFLRQSTLFERVVRSRRRSIGAGLTAARRLVRVPVEYRAEEIAVLDAVREMEPLDRAAVVRQACSSWDALAGMSGGKTTTLRARLDVIRDARVGRRPDAKLEALLDLCAGLWGHDPATKIVIRCEYAETRELVFQELRGLLKSGGLRRSTQEELDGWQADDEDSVGPVARLEQGQDAMLEALRNPTEAGRSMLAQLWAFERSREGGAVALVAGDVASTGLNLQFASALILYDLPWTPGLAEQWIGRLDRVGQRAGEVRVYAMSHRALPTERVLDVYESIGLFDERGYQVSQEVERRINDLLRPTDADESTWDEAVRAVQHLIDEDNDEDDPARGASLDLVVEGTPSEGDIKQSIRGFVEASAAAGFAIDAGRDSSTQIQWPLADADALWLPSVAVALRPPEAVGRRSSPEDLAAVREKSRVLVITDRRLGDGRWHRAWNVDLLSPRHPLFAEVEEDLLRDPSLALGGFRCSSATVKVPPGVYLIAQAQTQPALGGGAMAWRCHVPLAVLQDNELERFWATVDSALQRMMRVRCRAELSRGAWLLSRNGGSMQPQPSERSEALLAALPSAKATSASSIMPSVGTTLAAMERPADVLPPEVLSIAAAIAEEVSRDATLRLNRIITRRQGAVAAAGEGDAWRGLRDARARALDAALALRGILVELPDQARHGALEAATPRVVAAAVVEVLL